MLRSPRPRTSVGLSGTAIGCIVLALAFVAGDVKTVPRPLPPPAPPPARRIDAIVQVHDAEGHAIEGAIFSLAMLRGEERSRSDANGYLRVRLPLAEVGFTVAADGYALHRASTDPRILGPSPTVDVTLVPEVLVSGRVLDFRGEPVPGLTVHAVLDSDPSAPPYPGHVAPDGTFVVPHLPAERVVVVVRAPGFEEGSRLLDLRRGPVRELVFSLEPTGALVVTIVDANGEPAPRAELEVGGSGVYPPRTLVATDDGVVEWVGIPQGLYEVRARDGGLVSPRSSGVRIEPGSRISLELRLGPGATLRGRVLGVDDAPIARAEVVLSEDVLDLIPRHVDTGADGTFVAEGLVNAPHFLFARADGYLPHGPAQVAPGEAPVVIRLVQAATVRGRVVDALGAPVEGALVTIIDERGRPRRDATAPGAGGASGTNAAPGPLQGAGELGVTTGAVPPIPLGATTGAPSPLAPGAPTFATLGTTVAVTGRDGTFELPGIPPGTVQLAVEHPLHPTLITSPRRIAGGRRIDDWEITLVEGGRVDGRVVDSRSMPVAFVVVELRTEGELVPRTTVTARDGTFAFDGVLGAAVLTALPSGQPAGRIRVDVPAGRTVEAVLQLEDAFFEMSGRVLDANGYPVRDAQVSIVSLRARTPYEATVLSGEDGSFAFTAMPRPPYRLDVDHPDYAPTRLAEVAPRDRGDREIEVRLVLGGLVEGRLVDAWAREPATGAIVAAYAGDELLREDAVDRDGRFRLERLAPGRYTLRVRSPEHLPLERSIVLQEARWDRPHADVGELLLEGSGTLVGVVTDALGDPVPGARVFLPNTLRAPETRTDAGGRYELRNVPPGTHEVMADHHLAGAGRARRPARVDARERLEDVDVRLAGRMSDDEGTPGAGIIRGVAVFAEDADDAVVITWVGPGSAAEHAGVRVGDRLTSVDGESVPSAAAARALLRGPDAVRAVLVLARASRSVRLLVPREAHRPPR